MRRKVSVASTAITISVNCGGRERTLPAMPDPTREFGQLLRMYGPSSDVTVTIELANGEGQLLVALEAGSVFVGLSQRMGPTSTSPMNRPKGSANSSSAACPPPSIRAM
jgi:hypothetical protein